MKSSLTMAVLAASGLVSSTGLAQEWFAGGSVGQAAQSEYSAFGPLTRIDDTDTGYQVYGGYLISPLQGLVASYIDLGTASYAGSAFDGFSDSLSAEGFDISWIIGWAPGTQERISVFGKIGLFAWDQDVIYTEGVNDASPVTFTYQDEGTSFSFGFGADVNFAADGSSPWSIHAGWQLFKEVGEGPSLNNSTSGYDDDRELFSVGASYRFGRD